MENTPSLCSIRSYNPSCKDTEVGRILLDCALTKLYCNWDDAGTARYVVNATCWLVAAERNALKKRPNKKT